MKPHLEPLYPQFVAGIDPTHQSLVDSTNTAHQNCVRPPAFVVICGGLIEVNFCDILQIYSFDNRAPIEYKNIILPI